jgi:hypothetical protein
MSDSRFNDNNVFARGCHDVCCIETERIYDSCRDRDCYENIIVSLSDYGNEVINRTGNIRAKDAYIAWTYIDVDKVRFNRGFYSVNIRYYIKLLFEACIGGNKPHEFDGIVAVDKKVVLFGGEKHVNVFKSEYEDNEHCERKEINNIASQLPKAVVEATDPIVLDIKVFDKGTLPSGCCCCCCEIPERVMNQLDKPISDCNGQNDRYLTVSIGMFSIIKLLRSVQLLINATEYCVPDKECVTPCDENPCAIFNNMAFPTNEFCSQIPKEITSCNVKCK